MRVYLKIKTDGHIIPFDHQVLLTGVIHKWLGWNDVHSEISLYSFSRLEGGKANKDGILFEKGAYFFFSSFDDAMLKNLIKGIQKKPEMFNGLKVNELIIQETPDLSKSETFNLASPIFIKRRTGDRVEHILFNDSRASLFLKETLLTKMALVGLADDSLEIAFDNKQGKGKTKLITYKGINNKANWCPVVITGKNETKQFAWNVGLGNSTGIGFGAIK